MAKRIATNGSNVESNGNGHHGNGAAVLNGERPPILPVPKTPSKKASKDFALEIMPLNIETATFKIVGITSLIVHAWDEKAIKMMLDKQMGNAAAMKQRDKKDPDADFNASRYISTEGWDGVPATGFKAALVETCRLVNGLTMTMAKRAFFVHADGTHPSGMGLVRIDGKPTKRRDMVRINNGSTADIRFRAEYKKWSAVVSIDYNASIITMEQVGNLLAWAGYSEGICEWRPGSPESATGMHGRFRVDGTGEKC